MVWRIEFSPLAAKNLEQLDRRVAQRILKFLHERGERLDALERHRIVDAGAHASYGAVAFEVGEPGGIGFAQEGFVEFRLREYERHIHPRAGVL